MKKALSLLLALTMIIGLFPATLAVDEAPVAEPETAPVTGSVADSETTAPPETVFANSVPAPEYTFTEGKAAAWWPSEEAYLSDGDFVEFETFAAAIDHVNLVDTAAGKAGGGYVLLLDDVTEHPVTTVGIYKPDFGFVLDMNGYTISDDPQDTVPIFNVFGTNYKYKDISSTHTPAQQIFKIKNGTISLPVTSGIRKFAIRMRNGFLQLENMNIFSGSSCIDIYGAATEDAAKGLVNSVSNCRLESEWYVLYMRNTTTKPNGTKHAVHYRLENSTLVSNGGVSAAAIGDETKEYLTVTCGSNVHLYSPKTAAMSNVKLGEDGIPLTDAAKHTGACPLCGETHATTLYQQRTHSAVYTHPTSGAVTYIYDMWEISSLVNNGSGGTVKLLEDIYVTGVAGKTVNGVKDYLVVVSHGFTLDLNGYELATDRNILNVFTSGYAASPSKTMVIKNGRLIAGRGFVGSSETWNYAVRCYDGYLQMENVTVFSKQGSLAIESPAVETGTLKNSLTNCTIISEGWYGVLFNGKAAVDQTDVKVHVHNCTIVTAKDGQKYEALGSRQWPGTFVVTGNNKFYTKGSSQYYKSIPYIEQRAVTGGTTEGQSFVFEDPVEGKTYSDLKLFETKEGTNEVLYRAADKKVSTLYSLTDAVSKVNKNGGGTITLLRDVTFSKSLSIKAGCTLDLNQKTLTSTGVYNAIHVFAQTVPTLPKRTDSKYSGEDGDELFAKDMENYKTTLIKNTRSNMQAREDYLAQDNKVFVIKNGTFLNERAAGGCLVRIDQGFLQAEDLKGHVANGMCFALNSVDYEDENPGLKNTITNCLLISDNYHPLVFNGSKNTATNGDAKAFAEIFAGQEDFTEEIINAFGSDPQTECHATVTDSTLVSATNYIFGSKYGATGNAVTILGDCAFYCGPKVSWLTDATDVSQPTMIFKAALDVQGDDSRVTGEFPMGEQTLTYPNLLRYTTEALAEGIDLSDPWATKLEDEASKKKAADLAKLQQAIEETAYAYVDKKENVEYSGDQLTSYHNSNNDGVFAYSSFMSPEEIAPDNTFYTVCGQYVYSIYANAIKEYELLGGNRNAQITKMLMPQSAESPILLDKFDAADYATPEDADAAKKEWVKNWYDNFDQLKPGDVILLMQYAGNYSADPISSAGHAIIYVGNDTALQNGSGIIPNVKENMFNPDKPYGIWNLYQPSNTRPGGNTVLGATHTLAIMRPLNDPFILNAYAEGGLENVLSDAALARLEHSRMEVTLTAAQENGALMGMYSSLEAGKTYKLNLSITNNSGKDWTAAPVPVINLNGTALEAESSTVEGTTKTYTYAFQIPASAKLGDRFVIDGDVSGLPVRTLIFTVGGNKVSAEKLPAAAGTLETDISAGKGAFVNAFYKEVLGMELALPESIEALQKELFTAATFRKTNDCLVLNENAIFEMVLPDHVVGGKIVLHDPAYVTHSLGADRVTTFHEESYEPGDIFIGIKQNWVYGSAENGAPSKKADDPATTQVAYIYLGNDQVAYASGNGWEIGDFGLVDALNKQGSRTTTEGGGYDTLWLVVLRPSLKNSAATVGDTSYGSVEKALEAAGESASADNNVTVTLSSTALGGTLTVPENVTLDLNGQTLEIGAMGVVGGHITDSKGGEGLLKVPQNMVQFADDNSQIPIWDAGKGGYRLVDVKHRQGSSDSWTEGGSFTYTFRFDLANTKWNDLFLANQAETVSGWAITAGVDVLVNGVFYNDYVISDATCTGTETYIHKIINNSSGGYRFTLKGAENAGSVTIRSWVEIGGVKHISSEKTYTNPSTAN